MLIISLEFLYSLEIKNFPQNSMIRLRFSLNSNYYSHFLQSRVLCTLKKNQYRPLQRCSYFFFGDVDASNWLVLSFTSIYIRSKWNKTQFIWCRQKTIAKHDVPGVLYLSCQLALENLNLMLRSDAKSLSKAKKKTRC